MNLFLATTHWLMRVIRDGGRPVRFSQCGNGNYHVGVQRADATWVTELVLPKRP